MGHPDARRSARSAIEATSIIRLALIAVIMAAGVAGWWLWAPASSVPGEAGVPPGESATLAAPITPGAPAPGADRAMEAAPITVHVSGEVAAPGLVQLAPGARIADAIAAAGGVLHGADLVAVNLAAPVHDGEMVRIPGTQTGSAAGGQATAAQLDGTTENAAAGVTPDGKVAVNQADAAGLESLPGVGPVLAGRIVAHREEHGPFAAVEDLLDVSGIGEGRLEALRDLVVVP